MNVRAAIGSILCGSVMAALVIAGVAKLSDAAEFERHLSRWKTLPGILLPWISLAVPVSEVLLGGAWLLGLARGFTRLAAIAMLLAFVTALAIEQFVAEAPECRCFGVLDRWLVHSSATRGGVFKAGLLAGLLALSGWLCRPASEVRVNGVRA